MSWLILIVILLRVFFYSLRLWQNRKSKCYQLCYHQGQKKGLSSLTKTLICDKVHLLGKLCPAAYLACFLESSTHFLHPWSVTISHCARRPYGSFSNRVLSKTISSFTPTMIRCFSTETIGNVSLQPPPDEIRRNQYVYNMLAASYHLHIRVSIPIKEGVTPRKASLIWNQLDRRQAGVPRRCIVVVIAVRQSPDLSPGCALTQAALSRWTRLDCAGVSAVKHQHFMPWKEAIADF